MPNCRKNAFLRSLCATVSLSTRRAIRAKIERALVSRLRCLCRELQEAFAIAPVAPLSALGSSPSSCTHWDMVVGSHRDEDFETVCELLFEDALELFSSSG
mmetsp:Transcript_36878/g.147316  ORF Transcript_36878/g.147316 Transcript_36878/m.147316 type:complete len:101 (-) Transcript_36878:617-919(-)